MAKRSRNCTSYAKRQTALAALLVQSTLPPLEPSPVFTWKEAAAMFAAPTNLAETAIGPWRGSIVAQAPSLPVHHNSLYGRSILATVSY